MSSPFKHSVKAEANDTIAMTVTYSGHQKCEADHRWGKGVREQYILHLIVSGKGFYVTPQGKFSLSAGDIFLIRPYTEIEYYADEKDPWEYYWVNFKGEDSEYILRKTDLTPQLPVMHGCTQEIFRAMEDIAANPASSTCDNIELTGRLYILLSLLVKSSTGAELSSPKAEEKRRRLRSARDYIEINYPLPISVEDIAAAAGVSRAALFRLFKAELNTAPADYLIAYRIAQAKKLLSETDISITAVARSVGYEDNLYFSRAFKRLTGVSPSDYRSSRQKNCNKNPYN